MLNLLIGTPVGDLIVENYVGRDKYSHKLFECKCVCGNKVTVLEHSLNTLHTTSCGCLKGKKISKANTKHGKSRTMLYKCWQSMLQRCENTNDTNYKNYGRRGITVCERWHTFENFYFDMGDRFVGGTLERIDVNGNYGPDNCIWATMIVQQNNRRNNHTITYLEETHTITEWSRKIGINPSTLWMRLDRGMRIEQALEKNL